MKRIQDQPGWRGRMLPLLAIGAATVAAWLLVEGPGGQGIVREWKAGGTAMAGRPGDDAGRRDLPRIDLEEHRETETAAFGMG